MLIFIKDERMAPVFDRPGVEDRARSVKMVAGATGRDELPVFQALPAPTRSDLPKFDIGLADRYSGERLPRYTSYPTAPHFSDAVSHQTYGQWLSSLPADLGSSIYLHIPFCRSMCWYCGCHTKITRHNAPVADYLAVLRREIDLVAGRLRHPLVVRHLHFGGGTPTIMEPEAFLDLIGLLKNRFCSTADIEIAIEIDPRTLTDAMISALGQGGVTRASLGVQSFDPAVQAAVNRIQSFRQTAMAIEGLRGAGVKEINLDLIYGLPHQSVACCMETVRQCLALRPDRFAVFGYAHVPAFKKHQRRIEEGALPDGAARLAQAETIARLLTEAGYRPIGLDHYALPDDPMTKAQTARRLRRNFQGYTTDPSDILIGLGASAIGQLTCGYVQNEVSLPRYAERIRRDELATAKGHALTPDDRLRGEVIERLMCDLRVDVEEVCRKYGARAGSLLTNNPRLRDLARDGLIRIDGAVVSIPDEARMLVRYAASAFDAYLGSSGRPYSRAV
jgi:oxygen-independent coproporphyrinogen-3 oxidase